MSAIPPFAFGQSAFGFGAFGSAGGGGGAIIGGAPGLNIPSALLSTLPQTASIASTSLSWVHFVEALAISVLSGLLAGAYPAWRGAHLSPVEALRHD